MKKIFILLALSFSATMFAQKFMLEGIVKDKDSLTLEAATVYLQSISDSIPIAYGITNREGKFSLQVNTYEDTKAIFNIAYMGYKPYSKTIAVPKSDYLNLGTLVLEDQAEALTAISIIAKAPPVVIKKDTIEYNADSFKSLPNDKAEDLLKKLPGVEIDADGLITVNGVEVEAINVDGMPFFGEKNGEIALKNLPSGVISKVQVTDFKTNMQKFTGEESDSGTKEINFKIKKGKNRAMFGDIKVGAGTDNKYQGNANIFQVVDGKQLGVIAGTNNINMSRGFSALPNTSASTGYLESDFVGANYSKGKWNENRINSNYNYTAQDRETAQKSYRENFLPDLNYITESESTGYNESDSHKAKADLQKIINPKYKSSKQRLKISNETNFNLANTISGSQSASTSSYSDGELVSDYTSRNQTEASNYNIQNNFDVTASQGHGNYFNIGVNTNFSKSNSDVNSYSENILYNTDETIIQDQEKNNENKSSNINVNTILVKEIFEDFKIIPRYSATVNTSKTENFIYDFNEDLQTYSDFNENISTNSKYITTTLKPSLKLRYDVSDFRFEIEGAHTTTYRDYKDELIEARNFKRGFKYLTYSGRIRYRDEKGYKRITLDYNQGVNLPSVSQLQPVEDVSNITHIRVGNPDLEPQINHNIRFRYQNDIAFHNINVSGDARAEFTQDKILNSTITNSDLNKYTTYTNLNGDYYLRGNASVSKSYFNKKTNFNLNGSLMASFDNSLSLQNGLKFTAQTITIRPRISLNCLYNDIIDVNTSYSYSTIKSVYDTDSFSDNNYFIQNLQFNSSIFFIKNVLFVTNKVSYRYNSQVGNEYDADAIFWNAGVGAELIENKATVTLVGYDVLGKNNGYRRSVTDTYIQDVENRILEQYFMLNFTYKFGSFAGQKMSGFNSNKGRRGGRG
ncbi:outer membrane beta-barrel protein [Neotamlana laminarinivorans]|uniref:Outer membrane beta-barrel family protein n=1 Tax=Neotamlana laminarinivorans TaxID=2883124 RepID=A0A9X1I2E6_9FLAO|nr:outer membrane beta-barrel protein [Tamlana laminarinivorans]MCB4799956.1 outer membrane beta-barrel family protein [Tamlana laminarinivorans]